MAAHTKRHKLCAVLDRPGKGVRVAVIWLLRGTHSGILTYGPPTRTPVT